MDGENTHGQEDTNTSRYTDDPEEEHRSRKTHTNGNGYTNAQSQNNQSVDDEEADDPLQDSFLSDRTATSFEKSIAGVDRKSYLRSSYWWAGIILMTVGEAGNFLAYGFAPASIVSPLGVVALVSNCVIAPFMLKERFRQRDFMGVVIAVTGAVIVVLSAKTSENKIGPDEIWDMITRWEFEAYLGITVILIIALMSISRKYGRKTILIDIGLVGLFGKRFCTFYLVTYLRTLYRRVYSFVDQGRILSALKYPLACNYIPHNLCPCGCTGIECSDANSIYQPRTSTF